MSLIQELLNQEAVGRFLSSQEMKRFSPAEIRETIQALVANEQIALANALGDAGLSLYPHSEDILAITSLLAMTNEDWPLAVELMQDLMEVQGEHVTPFTYVMMVRALRCNLDPEAAVHMVHRGLKAYPGQLELVAEKLALDDYCGALQPDHKGLVH